MEQSNSYVIDVADEPVVDNKTTHLETIDFDVEKGCYNTSIENMEYSNNRDYRECLRRAFYMTCDLEHLMEENPDYDDETLDEELYEETQTKRALDFVYEKTKDEPIFKKMYLHGAAKMFSTAPDLGIAVLFSYDFFSHFHRCLVQFFNAGVLDDEDDDVQYILTNWVVEKPPHTRYDTNQGVL